MKFHENYYTNILFFHNETNDIFYVTKYFTTYYDILIEKQFILSITKFIIFLQLTFIIDWQLNRYIILLPRLNSKTYSGCITVACVRMPINLFLMLTRLRKLYRKSFFNCGNNVKKLEFQLRLNPICIVQCEIVL